jgi:symplekin
MQSRNEIFDDINRKRPASSEPSDGPEHTKRARHGPPVRPIPPLPPGPTSYAQLFTLTDDTALSNFDVKQLPLDLVIKITGPVLARIDQGAFEEAVNVGCNSYLPWSYCY